MFIALFCKKKTIFAKKKRKLVVFRFFVLHTPAVTSATWSSSRDSHWQAGGEGGSFCPPPTPPSQSEPRGPFAPLMERLILL